ncbi:MAG: hypothetical protein ACO2PO_01860 [Candidatus Calescibacterium sp.]
MKNLEFKENYVKEAEKFISNYQDYYKVAVHIRLGDFRNYYICGENPILPLWKYFCSYYLIPNLLLKLN